MKDLSLHVLELAENAVRAGATRLLLEMRTDKADVSLVFSDDGRGMSPDLCARAADEGVTTREKARAGQGLYLFRRAAKAFSIESRQGAGTRISARFEGVPLGDLPATVAAALAETERGETAELSLVYEGEKGSFRFDSREFFAKEGRTPRALLRVRTYLEQKFKEINGGISQ